VQWCVRQVSEEKTKSREQRKKREKERGESRKRGVAGEVRKERCGKEVRETQ